MAEEVQGQAPVAQPALQVPESMNPHEAVQHLTAALEEAEKAETTPRDEKGKFAPKTPTEEAKPETEAAKEETPEHEEEVQEEPRKLKLKYKGEDKEFLEPEVIELAQKGYDYTQKSQALAKERDDLQAKVKAESEQARTVYEQQLEVQKQAVQKLSGVKTMAEIEALSKTDPAGAQQEFLRAIAVNQTLQAIEAEQQKIVQQRQSEMRDSYTKAVQTAVEKLQEKIPGWNNDLYGKILKGGVEHYGFKSEEVNAITDHRAIEVLNDALKWRESQAAKPKTVDKRVAAVPKVQKPGTTEKTNPNADKIKAGMAQLNKSGSRQDAQALIAQMIESGQL